MRRRIMVVLVATVVLTGCASVRPDLRDGWHVATISAAAADVVTTTAALENPELREGNPVLTTLCGTDVNTACMVGIKAGFIMGLRWLETTTEKRLGRELTGWERAAFWMMPTFLWGAAAAWNATLVW